MNERFYMIDLTFSFHSVAGKLVINEKYVGMSGMQKQDTLLAE